MLAAAAVLPPGPRLRAAPGRRRHRPAVRRPRARRTRSPGSCWRASRRARWSALAWSPSGSRTCCCGWSRRRPPATSPSSSRACWSGAGFVIATTVRTAIIFASVPRGLPGDRGRPERGIDRGRHPGRDRARDGDRRARPPSRPIPPRSSLFPRTRRSAPLDAFQDRADGRRDAVVRRGRVGGQCGRRPAVPRCVRLPASAPRSGSAVVIGRERRGDRVARARPPRSPRDRLGASRRTRGRRGLSDPTTEPERRSSRISRQTARSAAGEPDDDPVEDGDVGEHQEHATGGDPEQHVDGAPDVGDLGAHVHDGRSDLDGRGSQFGRP